MFFFVSFGVVFFRMWFCLVVGLPVFVVLTIMFRFLLV